MNHESFEKKCNVPLSQHTSYALYGSLCSAALYRHTILTLIASHFPRKRERGAKVVRTTHGFWDNRYLELQYCGVIVCRVKRLQLVFTPLRGTYYTFDTHKIVRKGYYINDRRVLF